VSRRLRPHVLDANALLRFLSRGPGAEIVARVFKDSRAAGQAVTISVINWGETLYTLARTIGFDEAFSVLAKVQSLLNIVNADRPITEAAARLKAEYKLGHADCFAAAVTGKTGVLVTADPEFAKVRWLRTLALPRHKQAK